MGVRLETHRFLFYVFFLLNSVGRITGVRITDLRVPSVALKGDEVRLVCDYKEENGASLYTLKWYKDDQEFYRHQPGISPHTTQERCQDAYMYTVEGVSVDCWMSTEREVVLLNADRRTSGEFQCEVIGEHPKFRKEFRKSNLTVYDEPLLAPHIVGTKDTYSPSEYVSLNCTSANQEYDPDLTWKINGHPAHQKFVSRSSAHTMGLRFQARSEYFHRGMILVSCTSHFGSSHERTTTKELRSPNYLTAQEYHYNAGARSALSAAAAMSVIGASAMSRSTLLFV
ncbi:uncharacterized protein LOC135224606 isoform X2 [Macrobrachium nipponense]|uniref:uncharacterized protein LOC135224606 isoform X2 n=1 Tax=Macrobrachium nipponense TaxID=159736 RepID=UPI0030C823E7